MNLIISGTNRERSNSLKMARYYQQELQRKGESWELLSLSDLPSDPTVNVIGMISSADMKLLAYRKPGMKFRFMLASF